MTILTITLSSYRDNNDINANDVDNRVAQCLADDSNQGQDVAIESKGDNKNKTTTIETTTKQQREQQQIKEGTTTRITIGW